MSSTNKTTTLKLSQFVGTDKPDWLTDYNEDMEKLMLSQRLRNLISVVHSLPLLTLKRLPRLQVLRQTLQAQAPQTLLQ